MNLFLSILAFALAAASLLFWHATPVNAAGVCKPPQTGTERFPMLSPPLGEVVVGEGRLQVFSAPNRKCAMKGVFVVPRDVLVAYAATNDGWTSVMYMPTAAQGWVRASRLKRRAPWGRRSRGEALRFQDPFQR